MDELPDIPGLNGAVETLTAWSQNSDPQALTLSILLFLVVVVFRRKLADLATALIGRLLKSMSIEMSETVRTEVSTAMRAILIAGSLLIISDELRLPEVFGGLIRKALISVLVISVFAGLYRLLEPAIAVLHPKRLGDIAFDLSWVVRIGQFVVLLLAITAVLAVWNIDISSALTGVGVFGAGLAIAAQDLLRNLFAGMANMSEKRFSSGDWIAVEGGVEGIVSRVDVRSTTIMGFDRVPRYVPNADLSNAVILNKSRMDHRRVSWTIKIVREASDEQIAQVCAGIERHLVESGDFVTDGSAAMFLAPVGLSDASVDVMIYAFAKTIAYGEYLEVCSRLMIAIRAAVAEAETELAFPTQSIILHK